VAAKMVRRRAVDWDLDGAMFCLGSHGLRVVSRLGVHGCCSVMGRKLLGVLPARSPGGLALFPCSLRVVSRLGVHGWCSVMGRKLLGVLPAMSPGQ
jgi:hypothetical protein